MFARVATYSGDPEEMVRGFQRARGELERMEGLSNANFCVDRGSGKQGSLRPGVGSAASRAVR